MEFHHLSSVCTNFNPVLVVFRHGESQLPITMHEEEFLETVRQEGSFDSNNAARNITDATLQTLGERITDGEAADLAQDLPDEFANTLTNTSPSEADPFSLEEFVERVSERAGIDEPDVVASSRAVATAMAMTAKTELDIAREQLPSEFDVVFEPSGPITEDEFLETVQERAGLVSEDVARNATIATLRTLGDRLAQGQAADLVLYLPEPFKEAIIEPDGEQATDYSFDEFTQRVAQRQGAKKEDAKTHAQAVGSTLAETASDREISAAKKQLPDQFGVFFESPDTTDEEA